ncbi:MAG: hypothetical protein ACWA5A_04335 [Marinibacterium sp.]
MTRALIGHTGFVGSNLMEQQAFGATFNSRNFADMAGQSFDQVVCAGVQAVKWWANQNPQEDWAGIDPLLKVLAETRAGCFVLISTVDVYGTPVGVTEDTTIETDGLHAYGLHRWKVEEFVRNTFPDHRILRLPGLFGNGLKKNLIYDALNGGDLSGFDARSSFQFYNLDRIGADVTTAITRAAPGTYNLAVAPVSVGAVMERLTGTPYTHTTDRGPLSYDMQSARLAPWGIDGAYLETSGQCLDGIAAYAQRVRA